MRRYKTQFTFMVSGRKSIGKSTFLNSLLDLKTTINNDFNMYLLDIECEGIYKKVTAIDTPGLNSLICDTKTINDIVKFIKHQHDIYLSEETKVRRDPSFEDTRVHCLIYFISPSGLNEVDLTFLKIINKLVNILPVIGKGDSLNIEEEMALKIRIKQDLKDNDISCFDFGYGNGILNNNELWERMPLCIVGCDNRIREYKDGIIEIDNPNHCDFPMLKEILFSTHCESLIEYTDCEIYEKYRTDVLSGLMKFN